MSIQNSSFQNALSVRVVCSKTYFRYVTRKCGQVSTNSLPGTEIFTGVFNTSVIGEVLTNPPVTYSTKDCASTVHEKCRVDGINRSKYFLIVRLVAGNLRTVNSPQLQFYCLLISNVETNFMKLPLGSNPGH